ncbi:hypothetical protein EVAR_75612_1 [Eumeta japonica]|uniref:Uncharacterized protein n=1 Tax=Eumeta variegata TaxID=151549 RepID=A0A4C1U082_EUMVA|nr:hypothetical protein EVAR_75612_1 [Eumeta japonica]
MSRDLDVILKLVTRDHQPTSNYKKPMRKAYGLNVSDAGQKCRRSHAVRNDTLSVCETRLRQSGRTRKV